MAKILVTGGPVHAKLDSVKIVTNRFKGGRMAMLAKQLEQMGHEVTYLTSKHTLPPDKFRVPLATHDGFIDYMDRVRMLAPSYDAVILGAAVANLIPEPPWGTDKKFPSHDYAEGDKVMVPFRVAPRVINEVKRANPRCTLIGFKLLSSVGDDELTRAAYTVVKDAKADLVVANDAKNLDRKLLVTKERSVIEISDNETFVRALSEMAQDEHYTTVWSSPSAPFIPDALDLYFATMQGEHGKHIESYGTVEGSVFGCVAVRVKGGGFLCSPRGKSTIHEDPVYVQKVHHRVRHVVIGVTSHLDNEENPKASLNAPLLDHIFESYPSIEVIVHTHQTDTGLSVLPYAHPGTVRDSLRKLLDEDFEIEHHGTFVRIMGAS